MDILNDLIAKYSLPNDLNTMVIDAFIKNNVTH